ncbi:MAG TPA: hypothetical protein VFU88_18685 [Ktedonobacterales bacterium]|nr:hypothetical protein [Ktedonobacterales bacterium]
MSSDTIPTTTPAANGPRPPNAPTPADGDARPADDQLDAGAALLRLLVGGMLVGADQLRERLRQWEEDARAIPLAQTAQPQAASPSLRHALVGMAFDTETRLRRGVSTLLARAMGVADDANLAYTRLTLSARGTPLDRVRGHLDELLFMALTEVDRWSARGAREEQQGRRMAEQATVSVLDELLDYMAHNPEVRHLIEQQGVSLAGEALGEARTRAESADQWIERLAHRLLHRPLGDSHGGQAARGDGSPPAIEPPPAASATAAPAVPAKLPPAKATRSAAGSAAGAPRAGDTHDGDAHDRPQS